MGVLDGQAVSASVTNSAFLSKNANDATSYNLAFGAIINFPVNAISTAGTINALSSVKANVRLTGASVTLNGVTAGADGQVLYLYNATGSAVTLNSLSGSALTPDQIKLVTSTYSLPDGGGMFFVYDSTISKWVVVGTMDSMTATSSNTASTIVKRDGSGNFSAGTITANLSGSATSFTGSLSGDVTGTQGSTVVSSVGGSSASNVNTATVLANNATNLNTASTIVKRDASGNFSAGTITATLSGTATNFSGSLSGDVTGTQGSTVVSSVGGSLASAVNTGVVLANNATNLNTASTIVKRDASGNFVASQASLSSLLLRGSSSGTVTVSPPASVTSYALTLPSAQGSASTTLVNDGSGNLSWGSSGSGGGGSKNYFTQSNANPSFENATISPWSLCTLSGLTPTTPPSGAPTLSGSMTLAPTSTNPLIGTQSGQLTKGASNLQGQGFISGALTIDREDTAKVMYGSFSYEVVSGTVDFSGTSTQSLEIWVCFYNPSTPGTVTWVQPAGYRGMNQSSGQGLVTFSFQTDGNVSNNTYKIAVVTAQTSTASFVVNFDDFKVGPSPILIGAVMSEWQSYTPTWTGLTVGNGVQKFFWRRTGDSIEIKGNLQFGTTTSVSGKITFTLPSGLSLDNNKNPFPSTALGYSRLGSSSVYISGSGVKSSLIVIQDGTLLNAFYIVGKDGTTVIDPLNNTSFTWTSGSEIEIIELTVPILGWGSNVQMSNDTDTRVIASSMWNSANQAITANNPIPFSSVLYDNSGSLTLASGRFTAPVTGYYHVSYSGFARTTTTGGTINIYKNGVGVVGLISFANFNAYYAGSYFIQLNAGDYIDLRCDTACTLVGGSTLSAIRASGPSVIASSETVSARAYKSSGSHTTSGNTLTVASWNLKEFDTHGAFNLTTGEFTVPVRGTYQASATVSFQPNTTSSRVSYIAVNGNPKIISNVYLSFGDNPVMPMSGTLQLNAGDIVTVKAFQASGGTLSYDLSTGDVANGRTQFNIVKVGV